MCYVKPCMRTILSSTNCQDEMTLTVAKVQSNPDLRSVGRLTKGEWPLL